MARTSILLLERGVCGDPGADPDKFGENRKLKRGEVRGSGAQIMDGGCGEWEGGGNFWRADFGNWMLERGDEARRLRQKLLTAADLWRYATRVQNRNRGGSEQ